MMYVAAAVTSVTTVLIFVRILKIQKKSHQHKQNALMQGQDVWQYNELRNLIKSNCINLPAMLVDLDIFDSNVRKLINIARKHGKKLRIATKSIRCLELIKRVSDIGGGMVSGYMCYSVKEAELLYKEGLDDFFIAYPTVQSSEIKLALDMTEKGAVICLTVDSVEQVKRLNEVCKDFLSADNGKNILLKLSIDLDMSYKLGPFHLGAHRSAIGNMRKFEEVSTSILGSKYLRLWGVMGYEASVAGLPDDNPHSSLPGILVRSLKSRFYRQCESFRKDVLKYCLKNNIELNFFNGGGTGNIDQVGQDHAVTEVTAGSGFLQAKLFDYYKDNFCEPACCFALQCTRVNLKYICCQSGGFIASGAVSLDKCPMPFANPYELKPFPDEGFGEVQTPLQIVSRKRGQVEISLGDPVFFRPAKSGEIAEHFDRYILKREYQIAKIVPTYRGSGKVFY